jgi:hypothetical protein
VIPSADRDHWSSAACFFIYLTNESFSATCANICTGGEADESFFFFAADSSTIPLRCAIIIIDAPRTTIDILVEKALGKKKKKKSIYVTAGDNSGLTYIMGRLDSPPQKVAPGLDRTQD